MAWDLGELKTIQTFQLAPPMHRGPISSHPPPPPPSPAEWGVTAFAAPRLNGARRVQKRARRGLRTQSPVRRLPTPSLHSIHSLRSVMAGQWLLVPLVIAAVTLTAAIPPPPPLVGKEGGCPRCDPANCPAEESDCAFGLVARDPCGCCLQGVCGRAEGEKCFDQRLPLLPAHALRYGPCGQHLECQMRPDLKPRDEPEAVCVCKEQRPVCGTNNHTYEDECQLRRDAVRARAGGAPALALKHQGPCASAPMVISGPADQQSAVHTSLALDCEVKGYPTPNIIWEFKGDDGSFKVLPSDDLYVAVQVRGGPEAFMATSWVQIVDLRLSDSGVYTCVAGNSEGTARASAVVSAR